MYPLVVWGTGYTCIVSSDYTWLIYKIFSLFVEIKTRINDWQEYLFRRLSGAKTFSAEFLQKVCELHVHGFHGVWSEWSERMPKL